MSSSRSQNSILKFANPAQTVSDAVRYVERVHQQSGRRIQFLEEALGPFDLESYPSLRARTPCKITGGEVVTTAHELCDRVARGFYDYL